MSEILLRAQETKLTLISPKTLVGTQVNYDTLKVEFSPEWDDFVKTAVFYTNNKETISMILDINNTCIVPWEQTENTVTLYVGVFGIKEGIEIPTNFIMLRVLEGSAGGNAPPPPTISVYMQLIEEFRLARDYVQSQAGIATDKALEAFNSAGAAKISEDNAEEYKNTALNKLDEVITTNTELADNIRDGNTLKGQLDSNIDVGGTLKDDLDEDIIAGNLIHNKLNDNTTGSIDRAIEADADLNIGIDKVAPLKDGLDSSIGIATPLKTNLDNSIIDANAINGTLTNPSTGTIKQANDINNTLDEDIIAGNLIHNKLNNDGTGSIDRAIDAYNNLEASIDIANPLKDGLDESIEDAEPVKSNLDISIGSANIINNTLSNPSTGTIKQANDINNTLGNVATGNIKKAEDINATLAGNITSAGLAVEAIEDAIINNEIVTQTEFQSELADLTTDLAEHKLDYTEHLNSTMPHKIENLKTGKTYRYGYQISADGIPQVISEEVV